ncbi:hypothetical protein AAVH_41353 [Aphelenchoides avenae]|nr:hypothetical protein AAVH_41353 [Aphelenchus avenae]
MGAQQSTDRNNKFNIRERPHFDRRASTESESETGYITMDDTNMPADQRIKTVNLNNRGAQNAFPTDEPFIITT